MRIYGKIEKSEKQDDGSVVISGIASSELLDSQGDIVSSDAMAKALPSWMAWGNIREQHSQNPVGKAVSAEVCADGKTRLTARIVDSEAVKKVLAGVYQGFSIAGDVLSKMANVITRLNLNEISICDRPANPECVFSIWKSETKKPVMLDSKFFAKALGLAETATETEIADAFTKKLSATSPAIPAAASTPDLSAIVEAVKKAVVNPDQTSAIEKLTKSVELLSARATESDMLIQKSERQNVVEQASREGKVIPLTPDEIFGSAEKKIDAVPLVILKSILANAPRTVPMGNPRAKVPITTENNQVEIDIFDRKATLDPKVRSEMCKAARARSIAAMNEYFQKNSN